MYIFVCNGLTLECALILFVYACNFIKHKLLFKKDYKLTEFIFLIIINKLFGR